MLKTGVQLRSMGVKTGPCSTSRWLSRVGNSHGNYLCRWGYLPPALIYSSANCTLQASWVDAIKARKHNVFVSSSPTGWTNNTVGLAWLEQVLNRRTKQKARLQKEWRLLSMDFIEFCEANRILLAVFPPHSTHTLQPLDIVCFKPLSSNYTSALDVHLFKMQGMLPVQKGDFFTLF
jgi:hypothetical protein